jgi:thiol:disulfide interchange protein DsbD
MNKHAAYILSIGFAAIGLSAHSVRNGAVEAELVCAVASIQPGQPFTVALRMQHDPHWHTYWLNPGTGYPTSLVWKLPDGFKAGAIEWPVPGFIRNTDGKLTGYGYEGENFLLVRITPPADLPIGTRVQLQATAEWLMCNEVCVPGNANLHMDLPVSGVAPEPEEKWALMIAGFRERLPVVLPLGWSADATQKDTVVELHLKVGSGERPLANSLHFFSANGLIDHEQPQAVRVVPDGYVFRLSVAESVDANATRLVGVIRADTGWGKSGEAFGLWVDVPIRSLGDPKSKP